MTDAEMKLRESAQTVLAQDGMRDWGEEFWRAWPEDKAGGRQMASSVLALLDRIEALEADNAALVAELEALDARRDEAVEWIGVVREELVLAGGEGGDRDVALGNLRTLVKQRDALTMAAQRVVDELRHALKYPDVGGTVDTDIVRRAVVLLEEATTPGRSEKTP